MEERWRVARATVPTRCWVPGVPARDSPQTALTFLACAAAVAPGPAICPGSTACASETRGPS